MRNLHEIEFKMIVLKMIQNLGNKMEACINRLEEQESEAEEQISELEVRMVEITEAEQNKNK